MVVDAAAKRTGPYRGQWSCDRNPHTVSDDGANAVVQLVSTTYAGANHTHLTELLRDREDIDLSRPTVRRILTKAGIPSPRHRRPPKHRVRRQRMPQAGMLVQIDGSFHHGSFHRWLGDDGPQFTLLLAVDDATSAVVNAVFSPEEDTRGYFTLMQGLIEHWGRPIALYGDRHGVFKFSGKPRHIQPPVEATHFSKAMAELGIQQIFARSPQAKGRVERAAGTFQYRLVTELRLAGARTIDQANTVLRDFLPGYSFQFAVPAELDEPAYRPWDGDRPLAEVLCFKQPSSTTGALCSCCLAPSVPATPVCKWKSSNAATAASRSATRARSSPIDPRRPDPAHCGLPMAPWLTRQRSSAS